MLVSITIILAWQTAGTASESGKPVVDPVALGNLELTFAGNETQRSYLGISSHTAPSLSHVRADRLILVIFNSFCTICQAEARALNMFYQTIEEDPALKGRTKMIGIAAGNTPMEVEDFGKTYEVPFPVVADPNFSVNRAITSNLRIPMVITAKVSKGQTLEVLKTHLGEAKSMEDLLEQPIRDTRLDVESGPRYH
jgi:peroxiredoxin